MAQCNSVSLIPWGVAPLATLPRVRESGRYSHSFSFWPADPKLQRLGVVFELSSGEQLAQGPRVLMQNRKIAVDHFGG